MSLVYYLNCRDIASAFHHSKSQDFVHECRGLEGDDNHCTCQLAMTSSSSPVHYWPAKNRILKPLKSLTSNATFIPAVVSRNFQTQSSKTSKLSIVGRMALELAFKFSNYPSHVDKQRLAQSCNMTYRQIDIWFQNRRDRGTKQQSGVLSQVDSLENLRDILQNMLLLARSKQKKVVHDSIDMWRSQILPNAAPNSVPTPSISPSSINSDLAESTRSVFEDCNTCISECDRFSDKTDSSPSLIPTRSQFNDVFSFPPPQWTRQRSLKSNQKSTLRTGSDISSLLPNFRGLHVKGTTKAAALPRTDVSSDSMTKLYGSNENSPTMNFKDIAAPRKIAPLPRRRAPGNKGGFITPKGSTTTEDRDISICSNPVPFLSS